MPSMTRTTPPGSPVLPSVELLPVVSIVSVEAGPVVVSGVVVLVVLMSVEPVSPELDELVEVVGGEDVGFELDPSPLLLPFADVIVSSGSTSGGQPATSRQARRAFSRIPAR